MSYCCPFLLQAGLSESALWLCELWSDPNANIIDITANGTDAKQFNKQLNVRATIDPILFGDVLVKQKEYRRAISKYELVLTEEVGLTSFTDTRFDHLGDASDHPDNSEGLPRVVLAKRKIAECYLELKQYDKVKHILVPVCCRSETWKYPKASIISASAPFSCLVLLARAYLSTSQFAEAFIFFQAALKVQPLAIELASLLITLEARKEVRLANPPPQTPVDPNEVDLGASLFELAKPSETAAAMQDASVTPSASISSRYAVIVAQSRPHRDYALRQFGRIDSTSSTRQKPAITLKPESNPRPTNPIAQQSKSGTVKSQHSSASTPIGSVRGAAGTPSRLLARNVKTRKMTQTSYASSSITPSSSGTARGSRPQSPSVEPILNITQDPVYESDLEEFEGEIPSHSAKLGGNVSPEQTPSAEAAGGDAVPEDVEQLVVINVLPVLNSLVQVLEAISLNASSTALSYWTTNIEKSAVNSACLAAYTTKSPKLSALLAHLQLQITDSAVACNTLVRNWSQEPYASEARDTLAWLLRKREKPALLARLTQTLIEGAPHRCETWVAAAVHADSLQPLEPEVDLEDMTEEDLARYKQEELIRKVYQTRIDQNLKKAITCNAHHPMTYLQAGLAAIAKGDEIKALEQLTLAAALHRVIPMSPIFLHDCEALATHTELRGSMPASVLLADTRSYDILTSAATCEAYMLSRNFPGALEIAKNALKCNPKNPKALILIGSILAQSSIPAGREKAEVAFTKALANDPLSAEAAVHLSKLKWAANKPQEAVSIIESVLSRLNSVSKNCSDPTNPVYAPDIVASAKGFGDCLYAHLGLIYLAMGNVSEAQLAFQRALTITPGYPPALEGLQRLDQRTAEEEGEGEDADEAFLRRPRFDQSTDSSHFDQFYDPDPQISLQRNQQNQRERNATGTSDSRLVHEQPFVTPGLPPSPPAGIRPLRRAGGHQEDSSPEATPQAGGRRQPPQRESTRRIRAAAMNATPTSTATPGRR